MHLAYSLKCIMSDMSLNILETLLETLNSAAVTPTFTYGQINYHSWFAFYCHSDLFHLIESRGR